MSDGFLSLERLRELSGYHQIALIIKWLQREGVTYVLSRHGEPIVHEQNLANPEKKRGPEWGNV